MTGFGGKEGKENDYTFSYVYLIMGYLGQARDGMGWDGMGDFTSGVKSVQ
jgi:hypothetical protein